MKAISAFLGQFGIIVQVSFQKHDEIARTKFVFKLSIIFVLQSKLTTFSVIL